MKKQLALPIVLTVGLLAFGCEKKPTVDLTVKPTTATKTFETSRLGNAIDRYVSSHSAVDAADANKAFAELDGEIAELQERVAKTDGDDRAEAAGKLANLQSYRTKEQVRFSAAKATAPMSTSTPETDVRSGAEKVGDSLNRAASNVGDAAKDLGHSIGQGIENTGDKIKDATDPK